MSKKPIQVYEAEYLSGGERMSLRLEAKSAKGAARIAASYELDRRGHVECRLIGLLRWDTQSFAWLGEPELEAAVRRYGHFPERKAVRNAQVDPLFRGLLNAISGGVR